MTEKIVAAHQPNYLPWIGYFHKIHQSDVFVLLDDVEYTNGSWINRNRIKTPDGWTWLTVPVQNSTEEIRHVKISETTDWGDEHYKSLTYNYGKCPHYDDLIGIFETVYEQNWEHLISLNTHLLEEVAEVIGLDFEFRYSSQLESSGTKSDRILTICDNIDTDIYLSGQGAKSYMKDSRFETADIEVEYQAFEHPTYNQRFDDFVPNLSIIDILFNCGPAQTFELIKNID